MSVNEIKFIRRHAELVPTSANLKKHLVNMANFHTPTDLFTVMPDLIRHPVFTFRMINSGLRIKSAMTEIAYLLKLALKGLDPVSSMNRRKGELWTPDQVRCDKNNVYVDINLHEIKSSMKLTAIFNTHTALFQ